MSGSRLPIALMMSIGLVACEAAVSDLGQAERPPEPIRIDPSNRPPVIGSFNCDPATGSAPVTATCAWTADDPEGSPVRCALDTDGDGTPEYQLESCTGQLEQPHPFQAPGSYLVRLTAIDAGGARTTAEVEVVVGQPNSAPVISSFTATPPVGVAPLTSVISWGISDPDGDELTCALDFGADGVVEYTLSPCTSALTQAHTVSSTVDVLLTVTDSRGGSAQATVPIIARTPVGDAWVSKVEWGQSVVGENLRLVEGKPALLRVHVLADRSGLSGVVVRAEGFRGGTSLGPLALTGPASPPTAEAPGDLNQQFRALVPEQWVAPGLEVRVQVDPTDALPETNETNNELTVRPTLGAGTVLQLTSVPVVHQGATGSVISLDATLRRLWPIRSVANQTRAPYTFGGLLAPTDGNSWGQLLQELASLRQVDGSRRYYYGFVRPGYTSGIGGIGYVGQPVAVGRDDSVTTAAHELGHNMGRNHAPCGGAASADPNYPYAGARLGSYGFDFTSNQLVPPTAAYDVMSYCHPSWVSDYSYQGVQAYLEAHPPAEQSVTAPYSTYVLVSGSVTAAGVRVRPLHRVHAPASEREGSTSGGGPYTLRLLTAERVVEVPFDTTPLADVDDPEEHFTVLVPDPGPLLGFEVSRGRERVLRRSAAHAQPGRPELVEEPGRGRLRLRWDARARSHAMVTHVGPEGRTTLALWLSGGEAIVPTGDLPPGGEFEVSLSDGVNAERRAFRR